MENTHRHQRAVRLGVIPTPTPAVAGVAAETVNSKASSAFQSVLYRSSMICSSRNCGYPFIPAAAF